MNKLEIFSDKGTYDLFFNIADNALREKIAQAKAVIVDRNVLNLHGNSLGLNEDDVIVIDAFEDKKRPEESLRLCKEMLLRNVKRKDKVLALGGGITQDLVTFAASIMFRGINWIFVPTTLLAQADSCIGGKSSLNFDNWKNILGNFYPPSEIIVQDAFLATLSDDDIRSGIGEILKVHLLSGKDAANMVIDQMLQYQSQPEVLNSMTLNALIFKNKILEIDPLDTGLRLKMNYGHSFGHALEAATNFGIPHGIAVTIGLDIANYIALRTDKITQEYFDKVHHILELNLDDKDFVTFDFSDFIAALKKDKKNTTEEYKLVIPVSEGEVELTSFKMNEGTEQLIQSYFESFYTQGLK